jgi:hypothetical protein
MWWTLEHHHPSFQPDSTRRQEELGWRELPWTGFWLEITSYLQGRAFMFVLNAQINPVLALWRHFITHPLTVVLMDSRHEIYGLVQSFQRSSAYLLAYIWLAERVLWSIRRTWNYIVTWWSDYRRVLIDDCSYWTVKHITRDYTLQITITHRLVFSVSLHCSVGNIFQQWTFLCSWAHVLAGWRPSHTKISLF